MDNIDNLIQRIETLKTFLGIESGDYDDNGVNLRNTFNRNPAHKKEWAELERLETELNNAP